MTYDVTTGYIMKGSGMRSIRRTRVCQRNVDVIIEHLAIICECCNVYRVVNKRENDIKVSTM